MIKAALIAASLLLPALALAQNVTISATNAPADRVFHSLMAQTGKNFVYSTEVLKGVRVTAHADGRPLPKVLEEMFRGTDIEFKIRGNDVILKRRKKEKAPKRKPAKPSPKVAPSIATAPKLPAVEPQMLQEVVVTSRLEESPVSTSEIGAKKLSEQEILNTPTLLGEADAIKALQLQPGISEATEGMAGMSVHGGNTDENLYMLDNVPLYHVNHFAGLFSAFNPEAIRYIDFFKSSVPAKYDGRLSSFLDVRTKNGSVQGHRGSARLGLTSGAFDISGPIGKRTTYAVALRRSWYDVITIPMLAIVNSEDSQTTTLRYYFMDLNGKLTRRFSDRATAFVSVYFGDDRLRSGYKDKDDGSTYFLENEQYRFHWGNLMAQAGLNYRFSARMSAEFTAAYTRFFSNMKRDFRSDTSYPGNEEHSRYVLKTDNNINDWIARGDFDWHPAENSRVRFGANLVLHSFLPSRTSRNYFLNGDTHLSTHDSVRPYLAPEANVYIEDDWTINARWRVNAGLHASLFHIEGKTKWGLSPRLSVSYRPDEKWAVKGAYSRTTQYVHQLSQSYLSLPTDQWIPVTGSFKPQTADKISVGAYHQSSDGQYILLLEGYWKWMHNIIDYRDEYYLAPPMDMWTSRLTSGRGSSKGVDFKIEKLTGKLTGHISYSLAWADRTFSEKNQGCTYPSRFDNRHTINVLVNWNLSPRVSLSAAWTGHSGNKFTLMPQMWECPGIAGVEGYDETPLRTKINNYSLPFYHRLDLSCTVRNSRGYWQFGLYNAYCHMNTIAIRRAEDNNTGKPVFQKVKLLPVIPSISYTWQF